MNKQILFASALAVLGLTACEKALVDDIEDVGNEQVKNSMLQVRTRAGGSADETTVAYPVAVYVFAKLLVYLEQKAVSAGSYLVLLLSLWLL